MKHILTAAAAVATLAYAGTAFAQDEEVDTRFYDFNDMLIDGELQRPQGEMMSERGSARFDRLLNLEQSFVDEIEKGAEEAALE